MSLPDGVLATRAWPAAFLPPDDRGRLNREPPLTPLAREPIVDFERGGAAVGDASQGLDVKTWRMRVLGDGEVRLGDEPFDYDQVLFTDAQITELSFAFDQNMRPTVAYVASGQAKLYWFDPNANAFVVSNLAADVRSPVLTLDDKRPIAGTLNDILLFYFRGATLYHRLQRERYQVEYALKTFSSPDVWITRAGMGRGLRMQIEIAGPGRTPLP